MLLYDGGHFAQVFEGPRSTVEQLLANIGKDPRHSHVMPVLAGPVARRDFEGWAMGWDDLGLRKEIDFEPLRRLISTRTVTDPGIAYKAMVRFREGLSAPEHDL